MFTKEIFKNLKRKDVFIGFLENLKIEESSNEIVNEIKDISKKLNKEPLLVSRAFIDEFAVLLKDCETSINAIRDALERSDYKTAKNSACVFLNKYFDILLKIFKLEETAVESGLVESGILDDLINLGLNTKMGEISFLNPYILHAIIYADNMFKKIDEIKSFESRPKLHIYLFAMKTARLFKDMVISTNKKVGKTNSIGGQGRRFGYKISHFSKISDGCFKIEPFTDYGTLESIDISRLAEKIYYGFEEKVSNKTEVNFKCLITGYESQSDEKEFINQNKLLKAVLKKLLEENNYNDVNITSREILKDKREQYFINAKQKTDWNYNIEIEYADTKYFLSEINSLDPNDVVKKGDDANKSEYDMYFMLDSMFLYSQFYTKRYGDQINYLYYLSQKYGEGRDASQLFEIDSPKIYKNRTVFQELCDRTSAMLKDPATYNTKLMLNIRFQNIDYLWERAKFSNKIIYLYISRNKEFSSSIYNHYQIVRAERYNGKDVKIVRLSHKKLKQELDNLPIEKNGDCFISADNGIQISAYQFIKMYLSDIDIIADIFGVDLSSGKVSFYDFVHVLMDIKISIGLESDKICCYCFNSSNNDKFSSEIIGKLRDIFVSIFNHKNNFLGDDAIYHCVRKGLFYSLISKSTSYEHVLLSYLIFNKYEMFDSVIFKEGEFILNNKREKIDNYNFLHNTYSLIDQLDNGTSKYDIEEQKDIYYINNSKENWTGDILGIYKACVNLGYKGSKLYNNLVKLI